MLFVLVVYLQGPYIYQKLECLFLVDGHSIFAHQLFSSVNQGENIGTPFLMLIVHSFPWLLQPWISRENLTKESNVEGITFPDFKLYYKAIVIKQYSTGIKETYRWMEQNREPRNKHIYIWPTKLWQGWWEYNMGKGKSLQ